MMDNWERERSLSLRHSARRSRGKIPAKHRSPQPFFSILIDNAPGQHGPTSHSAVLSNSGATRECEGCECEAEMFQVVRGGGAEAEIFGSCKLSAPICNVSQRRRQMFVPLSQALDILGPVLVLKYFVNGDQYHEESWQLSGVILHS